MITLHPGDCLDVIPTLGLAADACVTDPPYHLLPTHKRFGASIMNNHPKGPRFKGQTDGGQYTRLMSGFMGQRWDGGDIAFRPETWTTIATALRPGAFLVAFGGTRTYHRLVCAIEDAGFVIQDTIAWLYGSGFPKRRDMLKPAMELIVLAYKPGGKRTMQVDECRIACDDKTPFPVGATSARMIGLTTPKPRTGDDAPNGRWPANLAHDGSEEVTETFPESASSASLVSKPVKRQDNQVYGKGLGSIGPENTYSDDGSAARFFYCAKADKQDRWGSRHPTVKPVELMKWLVALVTPPGGLVLDPFAGSGTTGIAALATGRDCILIEREEQYIADIRERLAFYEGGGTHSIQAKNRNRQPANHGPLFAEPYDPALDSALSYDAAIQAIGERVKAGEPVPMTGYFGDKL